MIDIVWCLISGKDAPAEPRSHLKVDGIVSMVSKRAHGFQASGQHQEATLRKAFSGRAKIIGSQSEYLVLSFAKAEHETTTDSVLFVGEGKFLPGYFERGKM